MVRLFLLFIFLTLFLEANDVYSLKYSSKNKSCSLKKNGKNIELFDKRFDRKAPKSGYSCSAIQKEHYNECHIVDKKGVKAMVFAYGVYPYTNLVLSFKTATKHSDGYLSVECTKKLPKK